MTARPPVASVVLPLRNAASHADEQLEALAGQQLAGGWELVVVDNGSTDRTRRHVDAWRIRLPTMRVVQAADKQGGAYARNVGVTHATAPLLVFCDGDDIVSPQWLNRLVDALRRHPMVIGSIDLSLLNDPGRLPREHRAPLAAHRGFLPLVDTCNFGVRREVFESIGGFCEEMRRACDADFGWRAQLAGYQLHFEGDALINKRLRHSASGALVRNFNAALWDPVLYQRFAGAGMPRLSPSQAIRAWYDLATGAPEHLWDHGRRYRYLEWAGFRLGRLAGSVRHRTWFP
ncbi:MAG: glycosyltransferase family 2 protein [Actinomycetota bacterium]|nr:glycosyltransferase family 2 protein [Actinomycetota bacterium]